MDNKDTQSTNDNAIENDKLLEIAKQILEEHIDMFKALADDKNDDNDDNDDNN